MRKVQERHFVSFIDFFSLFSQQARKWTSGAELTISDSQSLRVTRQNPYLTQLECVSHRKQKSESQPLSKSIDGEKLILRFNLNDFYKDEKWLLSTCVLLNKLFTTNDWPAEQEEWKTLLISSTPSRFDSTQHNLCWTQHKANESKS